MHQFSSDSAIDTTTDRPNHSPFWSTDLADAGDFLANELFLMTTPVSNTPRRSESLTTDHCPVCRTAADVKNKLADDFSSARRVGNFRMELDTVPWFVIVGDSAAIADFTWRACDLPGFLIATVIAFFFFAVICF